MLSISQLSCSLFGDKPQVNEQCQKECTTIEGLLTTGQDAIDGAPDLYMELSWSNYSIFFDTYRLIATQTSDKNGRFKFVFSASNFEITHGSFHIDIYSNDQFYEQEADIYGIDSVSRYICKNIHVPSIANIKLTLSNFNLTDSTNLWNIPGTYDSYGSYSTMVYWYDENGDRVYHTFSKNSSNGFSELELLGKTAGDQYTRLDILKIKNGDTTRYIDSVFVPKLQTKDISLNF